MQIVVTIGHESTTIDRAVFSALLDASVLSETAPYQHALKRSQISFDALVELGRKAQIPYCLFFAPMTVVQSQLKRKSDLLLSGVGKDAFSLSSRGAVRLSDVELIVKDLLRKQGLLKRHDKGLAVNQLVGRLKNSRRGAVEDAAMFCDLLDLDVAHLRAAPTKEAAFDRLVDVYEQHQLYVAQSRQNFMPQRIPKRAKFSGLCVRDKKIPFIFLTSGDADDNLQPAARRIFTLVLLGICVARGRFVPVTYSDQADELIANPEYETAEEVLLPAADITALAVQDLEDIKLHADVFRVSPSAYVMRARRVGVIDREQAQRFLGLLRQEFRNRTPDIRRSPTAINALRKYNGAEYSKRLLRQMDQGKVPQSEICRVLFQNKLGPSRIGDYRSAL